MRESKWLSVSLAILIAVIFWLTNAQALLAKNQPDRQGVAAEVIEVAPSGAYSFALPSVGL